MAKRSENEDVGNEWHSDALEAACRRLDIDGLPLCEAVIQRVDAGESEPVAVRMSLVEHLQRRGMYHGHLKRLVDSGLIFRVQADKRERAGDDNSKA